MLLSSLCVYKITEFQLILYQHLWLLQEFVRAIHVLVQIFYDNMCPLDVDNQAYLEHSAYHQIATDLY